MKYIGTVIWAGVYTLFSIAVLNSVYGDFEIIAVALLVLVYSNLTFSISTLELGNSKKFLIIYKKISKTENTHTQVENIFEEDIDLQTDPEAEDIRQAEELLEIATTKHIINTIANAIVWIAAIFSIINVL